MLYQKILGLISLRAILPLIRASIRIDGDSTQHFKKIQVEVIKISQYQEAENLKQALRQTS